MPLTQTRYGGECPLGVFKIDVPAGGGCYTSDTLEACFGNPEIGVCGCNYFRFPKDNEEFDPAIQCMCPADMTKEESRALKKGFLELVDAGKVKGTKGNFWEYVSENHKS
tara:strand:- start:1683 stop:2012 length:330 start_codon:yes stop_codon:yes gene_type:complete